MKYQKLKKEPLFEVSNNTSYNIQNYGIENDFPQQLLMLIRGSSSAMQGIDNYSKFIYGQGFSDISLSQKIINRKRQTLDSLLNLISNDLAIFGGFALHFNYNLLYEISEINYVPFETVRLGSVDKNGHFDNVKIHWDWAKNFSKLRRFSKEDIKEIKLYNPNKLMVKEQIDNAGGINNYTGQILYYTLNENNFYPEPTYSSSLTDISTEQGISNIDYRNVRERFLTGGVLVQIKNSNENVKTEKEDYINDDNSISNTLQEMQTDERACKIALVTVKNKDDVPVWLPMQTNNYDTEYKITTESIRTKIRTSFMQPPLLFSESVSTGFSVDEMQQSYEFYNGKTLKERQAIERIFKELFSHYSEEMNVNDFSIKKLQWNGNENNTQ